MNVNSVGFQNQMQSVNPNDLRSRMQAAMGPVAQLFGESPDQLMQELSSNHTSLSALAQQKGISSTDLVNAIKQGLQASAPSGSTPLSDTQLTNIANRIANHTHGGHHHRGGAGAIGSTGTSTTGALSGASDPDGDGDNDGARGIGAGTFSQSL